MEIIDLGEEHVAGYCKCLEDWSGEFDDENGRKRAWYEKSRALGLRVKLARDADGALAGMIQYAPAAMAPVLAKDLYYVYCVWVHGYKEGVGNRQRRGAGKALLKAAEEDARELGAKGLVAWGLRLPLFMRSAWFKRQGYEVADREGMAELVWKRFSPEAEPPRFPERKVKPEPGKDRVRVEAYTNGWCPAQNLVFERAKRAAAAYPGAVDFVGVETADKEVFLATGLADALFIDGREERTGPPPSYESIRRRIEKTARKRRLL